MILSQLNLKMSLSRPVIFLIQNRSLQTSSILFGAKAKRRKQNMRAKMPHMPMKKNTALPTNLALDHFDQFYSAIYKESKWGSIRLGLLSKPKHAALVNNFGDREETIKYLEDMGCIDISEKFISIQKEQEKYVR